MTLTLDHVTMSKKNIKSVLDGAEKYLPPWLLALRFLGTITWDVYLKYEREGIVN